jgi:hypothetical protein
MRTHFVGIWRGSLVDIVVAGCKVFNLPRPTACAFRCRKVEWSRWESAVAKLLPEAAKFGREMAV